MVIGPYTTTLTKVVFTLLFAVLNVQMRFLNIITACEFCCMTSSFLLANILAFVIFRLTF